MKGPFKKLSLFTLILACAFVSIYRLSNVGKKEIAWDVLGYYICLPSTFIYGEPMLDNYDWLKKINEEKDLSGTLYQVSSTPEGKPMYFFLFGMALFYLPFFFSGHAYASASDYPSDGFSEPYQYALVIGAIIYTIIGLIFLRKILRHYFSEGISSLVILIIVFGTNYVHHLTLHNLETVNVLFMLVCILLWNTIQWHEHHKNRNLIAIGLSITLMALVKPSEVLIVFLPLLWGVTSKAELIQKFQLLWENKKGLFLTLFLCFLLALPQMIYWQLKTGSFIYDSYKNPGIGLDLFSPHILDVLFSYRKGWLLYTPVMIFALWGFYFLYKYNRNIFFGLGISFFISFYIIASWSEWWYGAAFSCRPLITTYPLLAICMGYFFVFLSSRSRVVHLVFGAIICFFVFLNQFQWWQLRNYIFQPYRTTKAYYWATFLKTTVTEKDNELLLLERNFSGPDVFKDKEKYRSYMLHTSNFNGRKKKNIVGDPTNSSFFRMSEKQEFALTRKFPFNKMTTKDHVWIKTSIQARVHEGYSGQLPYLVLCMDHDGSYGYHARELKIDSTDTWITFEFEYLTPEIRNRKDKFNLYVWKPGKGIVDFDNLKVEVFEPIN